MIGNWYKYGIRASISIEKNLEIFSFFESLGYDRGNLKGKAAGYEIYAIGDDNRIHCITSVLCNIIFETLEDAKKFFNNTKIYIMPEKYYVVCPGENHKNAVIIDTLRDLGVNTEVAEEKSTANTKWLVVENNSVVACYDCIDQSLLYKITIYTLSMLKQMKNKLCIDIPEGYEVDEENSTFECIKFKKKELTYKDIAKELFLYKECYFTDTNGKIKFTSSLHLGYDQVNNFTSVKQAEKLLAINELMNVAKYLNDGWKPDWNNNNEYKHYLFVYNNNNTIGYSNCTSSSIGVIYFKTKELAMQAVKILGEDTIKLALSTDY